MQVQPCNGIYFNTYNSKISKQRLMILTGNDYSTCPNDCYPHFLPAFKATNIELISKMETALKNNKQRELMSLFEQMSDTAKKNVKEFVEKFKNNGLTLDNYISACVKQPQLFNRLPDTLEKNVREFVKKFEANGLTLDNYIPACIKIPPLFNQSPETLEKNVREFVKKFEANGLTLDNYIPACVKQPPLFSQSSETIEKNVRELVEKFKNNGLTLDNYISACVKQPSLFCQSPKTIKEHIDVLRFSRYNNGKEIDNEQFWTQILKHPMKLSCSSSLLLTEGIIVPKMFEGKQIPSALKGNYLKQKLEDYLKANPDKKYVLNIKNIPAETDCAGLLQNYLEKLTGELKLPKDMFKINMVG